MTPPESHLEYAQRVGPPRVVRCDLDLSSVGGRIWICRTHDYRFNERLPGLDRFSDWSDRCPMSRLEEWRQNQWTAAEGT